MLDNNQEEQKPSAKTNRLARIILATFLPTFMLARVVVFLVMSRTIPDLYMHFKGTHFHHLNYGIFLLSAVGAYLIFRRPEGKMLSISAGIYGIAMALTFDEFGMWIHLGGGYWQRASWDAVVILSALFALIAFAPSLKRFRPHHWITAIFLIAVLVMFLFLFVKSFKYASVKLGPKIHHIESTAPH
ncbi:MAG: hypothetical protein ABSG99_04760 [Sedimentisphaerales bacterium]